MDGELAHSEPAETQQVVEQQQQVEDPAATIVTATPTMTMAIDKVTTFKIFVRNLSHDTSSEELKALFTAFGRVAECEIFQNKTMAFVHMEDELYGRVAVETLNGRTVNGKAISVEESLQKYQGPSIPTTRLRVMNIPASMTARELRNLFVKYGIVVTAEISNREGIVSIEAIADIRSALNEVNGFNYNGCTLSVAPILNTSISYMPRPRKPELVPNSHSSSYFPRPRFGGRGSRIMRPSGPVMMPPRFQNQNRPGLDFYRPRPPPFLRDNPEGRVLRDPYEARPPPPPMAPRNQFIPPPRPRPHPFESSPRAPMMMRVPMGARPTFPRPAQPLRTTTSIDPLFLKRHELLGSKPPSQPHQQSFDTDDYSHAYNFTNNSANFIGPRPARPNLRPPLPPMMNLPPPPPPPPLQPVQPSLMGAFLKRSAPPDPGQPFAVPSMIAPGEFQPPRKYFANRPNRPKSKRRKTDRPQPPLPEEYSKPVPDFSDFYTMPNNAVLKPFPPPQSDGFDDDYSDDVQLQLF